MAIAWLFVGSFIAAAMPVAAFASAPAADQGPIVVYPTPRYERAAQQRTSELSAGPDAIKLALASSPAPASPAAPSAAPPVASAPPLGTAPPAGAAVAATQTHIHNPFSHDIDLTMALTFNQRDLGELPVTLTHDDRILVHSQDFSALIAPLLNAAGRKAVTDALGTRQAFEPDFLAPAGVSLVFDPAGLSVVILKIDPREQSSQNLYDAANLARAQAIGPSPFSAYLNINATTTWAQASGVTPYLDLQGVIHYEHLVLESEFVAQDLASTTGLSPTASNDFTFQRDYMRLVYDQPDQDRRFFIGDLSPELRDIQGSVNLGGVGVIRETLTFDPTRTATLTNNQQFVLNNNATVDILRNGELLQQLHLNAGAYNLNNLPISTGSNDLQIQIHDIAGGIQTLNFSTYLDPIDIQPGDYEYAAYLGVLSKTQFSQPEYGRDIAFTGFYRRAFLNADAFGVGLQADGSVQMADGEYRVILPGGARLALGGAVSHASPGGGGASVSLGYDANIDRAGLVDGVDVSFRYDTTHFQVLGTQEVTDPQIWTASVGYSHAFSSDFQADASVYYSDDRAPGKYSAAANIQAQYRFDKHWSVTFGVDYEANVSTTTTQKGLGGLLTVVWRPDIEHRAEVRYDGARDIETATFTKNRDNYVGSYGYSAIVGDANGQPSISGEADYLANRFDIDVQGGTTGTSFSSITSEPSASIHVGTSIGFVDGHFGVGRPISDSFMLAYPHPTLDGRSVIVGDDLQQGHYNADSGILGPALYSGLSAYNVNSVHYDVLNVPPGYDIGPGIEVVRPLYRSGYALQVGTDAFVSAAGTLVGSDGKPFVLVSGHVTLLSDPKAKTLLFFTNSGGRFAIEGLKPGQRYRVDLNSVAPISFEFETPKTGVALVNLKTVTVNALTP